ncbi:MAG: glycosyltransferase family 2 protein [Prevotella sp.]|jgi:glycosyltransferase involved in cell wall biosynthesis
MIKGKHNMNIKISVVVPVYNGEKYIRECIDSILAQTFQNFELILIDDESPDNCGAICDEYAVKDERVRVVHQKNQGINHTRRNGVRKALGEWVVFVDNDDTLPKDALQRLYEQSDNTDLVIGFPDKPVNREVLTLEESKSNAITAKLFPPAPWAKLYRRSLFSESTFDFPRGIEGEEDMIMNIRIIFSLTRPPHFVFERVYNFRRNLMSVSHTKKASIAHEELFDKSRIGSIPAQERARYMKAILWSRINGLYGVAYVAPDDLSDKHHPFLLLVKKDIRHTGYKLSFLDWVLLNISNKSVLKAVGFVRAVYNFVKYHLGLNN